MRPKTVTITMVAADRDGICKAQSKAGAGTLTLNGDLSGTMDVPRHVSIYAAGDNSAKTFTITGTDRYGKALTEDITGPNATTVKGTKNFKTVTAVAIDAASVGNVEVGSADELESQIIPLDYYGGDVSVACTLSACASLTYHIYHTLSDLYASTTTEDNAVYHDDFGAFISNMNEVMNGTATGLRFGVSGFSSGALTIRILTQNT